jgi:NTE family protein
VIQHLDVPKAAQRGRPMENAVGLVMTGGGARGAYQAGVLKRIGELKRVRTRGNPFPIIGGASAGAINGSALATGCHDFASATQILAELWATLKPSDIFHCDVLSQVHNSITWILDLSFGAVLGGGNARSLLDATPLRHFLNEHLECDRIQENIKHGHLYALAISATNYNSGKSYLFIQGMKGHPMWKRIRLVTVATKITVDHVCASCAIPLVFQTVRLTITHRGSAFFGDGGNAVTK